jgi:hypothetical protein
VAPRLPGRDNKSYWAAVRRRAAELGSDGCTKSPDFDLDPCLEHDVHWRTGRTIFGDPITECEANNRFRQMLRAGSRFRRWLGFSPLAGAYWVGVTFGALFHKHPTNEEVK